jgi:hypothetical protein
LLLIENASHGNWVADGTHGALLGYVTRDPTERYTTQPLFSTACLYHAFLMRSPVMLRRRGSRRHHLSRIALAMCPTVVMVSALWWARYVLTQPPSRRMSTVSSSPNRAISAAMIGRLVR